VARSSPLKGARAKVRAEVCKPPKPIIAREDTAMITRRSVFTMLAAAVAALPFRRAVAKAETPRTIDELMRAIEARFECRDGLRIHRCQTGDVYQTLVVGGVKRPGDPFPAGAASEADAVAAWFGQFEKWSANKSGILYWRARPELEPSEGRWQIYSRLAISDKPESYRTFAFRDGWIGYEFPR